MSHAHHGHSHGSHDDHHHHASFQNIGLAFTLNLFLTLIEIAGSVWSGSLSVLAGAIHDLGDTLSLALSLFLERYSQRRADKSFSYGYRRFSLLSALLSGLMMLAASAVVFYETWHRLREGFTILPNSRGMILLALLGVAFNGFAAWRLSRGKTQNEKILTWHLFEDMAGWALIILGGVLIYFKSWAWLDPCLGVALTLYVLWNVLRNLNETARLFLQGRPQDFDEELFRKRVLDLKGVEGLHDLHVWSLDGHRNVLSLHIVLSQEAGSRAAELKKRISEIAHEISKSHAMYHLTIETESRDEACRESC